MRYGIEIVPFGEFANPRWPVRLAQAAEEVGWEAVWTWDHVLFPWGAGDPWVIYSAIAALTQKLLLVPGVAALPRYQPHLLARMLTGLDLLSQGRVILGAGAGAIKDEFLAFGGPAEPRTRAEMLDEGLVVLSKLFSGVPVQHQGKHYTVNSAALQPTPFQKPRLPVWIGGESPAALRRAARWDGWIMGCVDENEQITCPPERVAKNIAAIQAHRTDDTPFDVAVDGISEPGGPSMARAYAEAGATWYFEVLFPLRGSGEAMLERIKAGPPV